MRFGKKHRNRHNNITRSPRKKNPMNWILVIYIREIKGTSVGSGDKIVILNKNSISIIHRAAHTVIGKCQGSNKLYSILHFTCDNLATVLKESTKHIWSF
jgi:hypothetical protein